MKLFQNHNEVTTGAYTYLHLSIHLHKSISFGPDNCADCMNQYCEQYVRCWKSQSNECLALLALLKDHQVYMGTSNVSFWDVWSVKGVCILYFWQAHFFSFKHIFWWCLLIPLKRCQFSVTSNSKFHHSYLHYIN